MYSVASSAVTSSGALEEATKDKQEVKIYSYHEHIADQSNGALLCSSNCKTHFLTNDKILQEEDGISG